jgi:hypothetical protein
MIIQMHYPGGRGVGKVQVLIIMKNIIKGTITIIAINIIKEIDSILIMLFLINRKKIMNISLNLIRIKILKLIFQT